MGNSKIAYKRHCNHCGFPYVMTAKELIQHALMCKELTNAKDVDVRGNPQPYRSLRTKQQQAQGNAD